MHTIFYQDYRIRLCPQRQAVGKFGVWWIARSTRVRTGAIGIAELGGLILCLMSKVSYGIIVGQT